MFPVRKECYSETFLRAYLLHHANIERVAGPMKDG